MISALILTQKWTRVLIGCVSVTVTRGEGGEVENTEHVADIICEWSLWLWRRRGRGEGALGGVLYHDQQ